MASGFGLSGGTSVAFVRTRQIGAGSEGGLSGFLGLDSRELLAGPLEMRESQAVYTQNEHEMGR